MNQPVAVLDADVLVPVHDVTQGNDAALAGIIRKDRHVAALALTQHADLVVTNDRRLRREIDALTMPLRALSADEFVLHLVLADRTHVDDVIDELVTKRQRRPVTRAALLDQLAVAVPRAIAELRSAD